MNRDEENTKTKSQINQAKWGDTPHGLTDEELFGYIMKTIDKVKKLIWAETEKAHKNHGTIDKIASMMTVVTTLTADYCVTINPKNPKKSLKNLNRRAKTLIDLVQKYQKAKEVIHDN